MTRLLRRWRWIILLYLLSTSIVVGVGYFWLGMTPSYDRQCWGWTSE